MTDLLDSGRAVFDALSTIQCRKKGSEDEDHARE
jgi:hypothetical protein